MLTIVFFVSIPQSNAQEKVSKVYEVVDRMPEYPGGETALVQDIASIVKYPEGTFADGSDGKVYVNFVVNREGKMSDVKIARGIGPDFDREALRVINKLEKAWSPGINNDQNVDVSIVVLFEFKKDRTVTSKIFNPEK